MATTVRITETTTEAQLDKWLAMKAMTTEEYLDAKAKVQARNRASSSKEFTAVVEWKAFPGQGKRKAWEGWMLSCTGPCFVNKSASSMAQVIQHAGAVIRALHDADCGIEIAIPELLADVREAIDYIATEPTSKPTSKPKRTRRSA